MVSRLMFANASDSVISTEVDPDTSQPGAEWRFSKNFLESVSDSAVFHTSI
jgi:hypothetical protein